MEKDKKSLNTVWHQGFLGLRRWDLKGPPPSHRRCASLDTLAPSPPCFGRFRCTKAKIARTGAQSPSRVAVYRLGALLTLGSARSRLGRHRKRKTILNRFPFANPTSYARRIAIADCEFKSRFGSKKKNRHPIGCLFFFLVAEVGFEPHGLRVMS